MLWSVKHIEKKWLEKVEAKNVPEAVKLALEAQGLTKKPPGTMVVNILKP
jgi:hypothetical protein